MRPERNEGRRWHHEQIDSTNLRALAEIEAGRARHLDVHVARAQSAGHGRRGRPWDSQAGEGLYLTLIWMPDDALSLSSLPVLLTMAAGVGVLDAARSMGLSEARLKWPNDVVVPPQEQGQEQETAAAKLAGVLIEARSDRIGHAIGVGMNVSQRDFPAALLRERPVTSLALAGIERNLAEVEMEVLKSLQSRLESLATGPGALTRDFLDATGLRGQRVRVESGTSVVLGRLLEVDAEGGLKLAIGNEEQRLELAHVSQITLAPGDAT